MARWHATGKTLADFRGQHPKLLSIGIRPYSVNLGWATSVGIAGAPT
jgi:hypothetical protein